MSFLTGKPARNQAFQQLNAQLNPRMMQQSQVGAELTDQGRRALDTYMIALGQGGDEAFNRGFEQFKNASGYRNVFNEAMRGVSGSMAARGLLASGSTAQALQDRANQLAQGTYSNYLGQLLGGVQTAFQGGQGALNAAQGFGNTIAGAGQVGAQEGLGGLIGQGFGIAAKAGLFKSDRRAKKDIIKVGQRPDGLGVYEYTLKDDGQRYIGVMADEVAQYRPDALGPITADGFATVDYTRL